MRCFVRAPVVRGPDIVYRVCDPAEAGQGGDGYLLAGTMVVAAGDICITGSAGQVKNNTVICCAIFN